MRYGIPVLAIMLLGPACGREAPDPRPELDALLQRLDAMDKRLDTLEDEITARSTADEPSALPQRDPLGEPLRLPTATNGIESTLSVRITAKGGVELDGTAVASEDVLARFREIARAAPGTRLVVLAETDVPYDAVIRTLDLAREAGLTDIAMSARIHGEGAVTAGL